MNTKRVIQYFATIAVSGDKKKDSGKMQVNETDIVKAQKHLMLRDMSIFKGGYHWRKIGEGHPILFESNGGSYIFFSL